MPRKSTTEHFPGNYFPIYHFNHTHRGSNIALMRLQFRPAQWNSRQSIAVTSIIPRAHTTTAANVFYSRVYFLTGIFAVWRIAFDGKHGIISQNHNQEPFMQHAYIYVFIYSFAHWRHHHVHVGRLAAAQMVPKCPLHTFNSTRLTQNDAWIEGCCRRTV